MVNPTHKLYGAIRYATLFCCVVVGDVTFGGMGSRLPVRVVELGVGGACSEHTVVEVAIAFVHTERRHVFHVSDCFLIEDGHVLDKFLGILLFFLLLLLPVKGVARAVDDLLVGLGTVRHWVSQMSFHSFTRAKLTEVKSKSFLNCSVVVQRIE